MKLDVAIGFDTPLAELPEIARRAEAHGFDGLWTPEVRHDPFLRLALVAEHTTRALLGTAVAVAFARSPTSTAHSAWDLAELSGGRFILGLGTQVKPHIQHRFAMPWSGKPVAQLRDYIGAIRAVWQGWQTGQPVRYRGVYYDITLMTPFFSPGSIDYPDIPIHIAAVGPAMCRLAGQVGDGLVVHPLHTRRYLGDVLVPSLERGLNEGGRGRRQVEVSASILVATSDEEHQQLRRTIAFYASTPTYRSLLRLHGWEAIGGELSQLARARRWEAMEALITDEMLDEFAISAPWEQLAARIAARYAGIADRLSLYRGYGDPADDARWRSLIAQFRASQLTPGAGARP